MPRAEFGDCREAREERCGWRAGSENAALRVGGLEEGLRFVRHSGGGGGSSTGGRVDYVLAVLVLSLIAEFYLLFVLETKSCNLAYIPVLARGEGRARLRLSTQR